jgi:hypothetical protein
MASWKKILVEGDAVSDNIGTANLTLSGNRTLDTDGNDLYIKNGAANLLVWSASAGTWTFSEEVLFKNNQGFTAGEIRLNEDPINGSNYISLRAPDSMSANLSLELPATDGTSGQALVTDGAGNLSFATVGGGSNTNIANANLTADNNRTLDMDANTLTIDINDGEFTVSDSTNGDTYIQVGSNVLQLGDTGMAVESDGVFQAKLGIEHDEANLTVAGAYGAGSEITYLGASATSTTEGRIYYYNGTTWASYSSSTEAAQKALLGIAIGTTMAKGFLLKGFVNPNGTTNLTTASPVYGAANSSATTTAPTSGYQRVMGHSISTSVMFFNPSTEYIDLA